MKNFFNSAEVLYPVLVPAALQRRKGAVLIPHVRIVSIQFFGFHTIVCLLSLLFILIILLNGENIEFLDKPNKGTFLVAHGFTWQELYYFVAQKESCMRSQSLFPSFEFFSLFSSWWEVWHKKRRELPGGLPLDLVLPSWLGESPFVSASHLDNRRSNVLLFLLPNFPSL